MGITVELVRSVFSKSRSIKVHESNARVADKRRWSSVRTYLCGDEFSSTIAEEDSTSFNISEITVTPPVNEEWTAASDIQSTRKDARSEKKWNPEDKQHRQVAAAVIVQSAFRGFMVRRQYSTTKFKDMKQQTLIEKESSSKESPGTSIEVQIGDSVGVISAKDEARNVYRFHNRNKPQAFQPKEGWDDSTVDSNISKTRMQNRLEAMTRRERALAYAFSLQLRICSKKRESKSQGTEPHMGLSWLDRWMAAHLPENLSAEACITKQLESVKRKSRTYVKKKHQDLSFEEKESSGSNEIPIPFDNPEVTAPPEKFHSRLQKNRLKATKGISRRTTVPKYYCSKQNSKENLVKRSRMKK